MINNGFTEKIASKELLQEMFEKQKSIKGYLEPTILIDEVAKIASSFARSDEYFTQNGIAIFEKKIVPKKQLYALFLLNKIISIANNK